MRNPSNPKERNLLKGAIRRVFSRSDLRRQVIETAVIEGYSYPGRPRVTKWCKCTYCGNPTPKYQVEVDHVEPVVPIDKRLEDMTWDDLVNRIWCEINNLKVCCKPCHKEKSKAEGKERRAIAKAKKT